MATHEPRREIAEGSDPAGTLIWDFQPPELGENKCLSFKPPTPLYVVMAA